MARDREDFEHSAQGQKAWFTTTHWSIVLDAAQKKSPTAEEALNRLCTSYRQPLYKYVRKRGYSHEDGEDLIQKFFARLLEKDFLADVLPEKGRFRSFLLAAMSNFMANERDWANAKKRGGGVAPISLDAEPEEGGRAFEPATNLTPEKLFDRSWATTLMDQAFADVREEYAKSGKAELFNTLSPFITEDSNYGDYGPVARRLGMSENNLAVAVHRLKKSYRKAVRAQVAQTVVSPADLEEEMKDLFAALTE
jgi:RNA polymerase sigma-70 factor (ECF subfamily)